MKTQLQTIRLKLHKDKSITNLWAIQHSIWRLGARINELRDEGMRIETIFRNKKGERNTKYLMI